MRVRRISPEFRGSATVARALVESTDAARRATHPGALHCHGWFTIDDEPVQILERPEARDLFQLSGAFSEVKVATFIARQIAEAIVHAHSLGAAHDNLAPRHIYATTEGALKIDFGIMG